MAAKVGNGWLSFEVLQFVPVFKRFVTFFVWISNPGASIGSGGALPGCRILWKKPK